MAKTSKLSNVVQVEDYIKNLDHPLRDVVASLRKIILSIDKKIAEQIKWNSPAFYYTGEMKAFDPKEYKRDIVVFNLHKKDLVLLIFPTGARINDQSALLAGKFTDGRKTASFKSLEDVKKKEKDLRIAIKTWLQSVDK